MKKYFLLLTLFLVTCKSKTCNEIVAYVDDVKLEDNAVINTYPGTQHYFEGVSLGNGTEPLAYTWTVDGEVISNNQSCYYIATGDADASLSISNGKCTKVKKFELYTGPVSGNCTDNNEPSNNSTGYAVVISPGTYRSQIGTSNDVDYYRIATTGTSTLITAELKNLPKNYSLQLVDYYGTILASSYNASTANESLTYAGNSYTNYYLRVYGAYSSEYSATCYDLVTSLSTAPTCAESYESNNSSGTAKTIPLNTTITSQISIAGDNDYYTFTTAAGATNIKVTLANLPYDYDLTLYSASLNYLASSAGTSSTEELTYASSSPATYIVRVYPYSGYSNTQCYTLRVSTSNSPFRVVENEQATVSKKVELK